MIQLKQKDKIILILFILALVPLRLVAQSSEELQDKRDLTDFTTIHIPGEWDAMLRQDENFSLTIEINKEYLDDLSFEVKNETLYVYNERRNQYINTPKHSEIRKVHITLDEFQGTTTLIIGDIRRKKNRHEIERTLHHNNIEHKDYSDTDTKESSGLMNQYLGLVNRYLDAVNQFVCFICQNAGFDIAL